MPVKILFDYGVSQKMASYIAGENVLIISDPFLYQNGVAQRIGESLIGKTVGYFSDIEPNPSCESVDAAAAAARKVAYDPFLPVRDEPVGVAGMELVGPHLVVQAHQFVAEEAGGGSLDQDIRRQAQAGAALEVAGVEADDGHLRKARPRERLAQQVYVIGGAAAAAGLGDDEHDAVGVVPAAAERVDKLADDEQGRIARVVVYILQPLVHDVRTVVFQDLHVVALLAQHIDNHAEVDGRHLRNEQLVRGAHLFCELGIGLPAVLRGLFTPAHTTPRSISCSASCLRGAAGRGAAGPSCSSAANMLRRRMLTAPRPPISSILIWV